MIRASIMKNDKGLRYGEWLQSKKWSLPALPLGLTFFLVNGEIAICSDILQFSY